MRVLWEHTFRGIFIERLECSHVGVPGSRDEVGLPVRALPHWLLRSNTNISRLRLTPCDCDAQHVLKGPHDNTHPSSTILYMFWNNRRRCITTSTLTQESNFCQCWKFIMAYSNNRKNIFGIFQDTKGHLVYDMIMYIHDVIINICVWRGVCAHHVQQMHVTVPDLLSWRQQHPEAPPEGHSRPETRISLITLMYKPWTIHFI